MKYILFFLFRFYKMFVSPMFRLVFGGSCKFSPTCSEYAYLAMLKHGFLYGLFLSIMRILRCSILTNRFGFDPVP
ncbi:MAG: membrane protein insertion efficiency factor YidD [Patescibacteria group bacterium]|nr:membrane protein insertion efficiency factor YidD [Patescibacteria group bacterium]